MGVAGALLRRRDVSPVAVLGTKDGVGVVRNRECAVFEGCGFQGEEVFQSKMETITSFKCDIDTLTREKVF